MTLRTVSKILIGTAVVGLAIYDLIPFLSRREGDTVSEVMRDGAKQQPALPFALGFVCGHWFWTGR
jgi:hypothetical protein